jgi:hypothetical protein
MELQNNPNAAGDYRGHDGLRWDRRENQPRISIIGGTRRRIRVSSGLVELISYFISALFHLHRGAKRLAGTYHSDSTARNKARKRLQMVTECHEESE